MIKWHTLTVFPSVSSYSLSFTLLFVFDFLFRVEPWMFRNLKEMHWAQLCRMWVGRTPRAVIRFSGSGSSICLIRSLTSEDAVSSASKSTLLLRMLHRVSTLFSPLNGQRPASMPYKTHPRDQISISCHKHSLQRNETEFSDQCILLVFYNLRCHEFSCTAGIQCRPALCVILFSQIEIDEFAL